MSWKSCAGVRGIWRSVARGLTSSCPSHRRSTRASAERGGGQRRPNRFRSPDLSAERPPGARAAAKARAACPLAPARKPGRRAEPRLCRAVGPQRSGGGLFQLPWFGRLLSEAGAVEPEERLPPAPAQPRSEGAVFTGGQGAGWRVGKYPLHHLTVVEYSLQERPPAPAAQGRPRVWAGRRGP